MFPAHPLCDTVPPNSGRACSIVHVVHWPISDGLLLVTFLVACE